MESDRPPYESTGAGVKLHVTVEGLPILIWFIRYVEG